MADDPGYLVSSRPTKVGDTPLGKPGQAFPVYATDKVKQRRAASRQAMGLPADEAAPITKPPTTRSMSKR